MGLLAALSRKMFRAAELFHLLAFHAADWRTRRALLRLYAGLGNPEVLAREVTLRLRFGPQVLPLRLRGGDVFVLGELLHEDQYPLAGIALPPDAVIVDAGANVGVSALWLHAHAPGGRLHAFEPEAENFRLLSSNMSGLPGAVAFCAALGAADGTIRLHRGDSAATHSVLGGGEAGEGQDVPLRSLEGHLSAEGIGRVDLLKLDVEGAELDVLKGLGPRIGDVQAILGEMHEALASEPAFYAFLAAAGFQIVWKRYFREGRALRVHGFLARRVR